MPLDSPTAPPQTRVPVDGRQLPWIRALAADYAFDYAKLDAFFAGDPSTAAAWTDTIRRVSAAPRDRERLAALLAAQQARRGAPSAARDAAATLADSRAVAIVTGQQAGLFGGPIFTLLKAMTAVGLARRVSAEHGVPVVPVFWVDAEDHDWDEVRRCTVLDKELTPASVALADIEGAGTASVARLMLTSDVERTLETLAAALPDTEFHAALLDDLRATYTSGTSMAEAFARWLERVLGRLGLVVFEASDPAAKPFARNVFLAELGEPGVTARLATEAGQALVDHGYHAQATPSPDTVSLFLLEPGRTALRVADNGGFTAGDRQLAAADLQAVARDTPERLSPNVLLRPLVQDSIFPTICYVAGPNELAYLGQLKGVYERFGVQMPLMYPRASATIADSAALRFLGKYDLPFVALGARDEQALNALLARQLPATVDEALTAAGVAIDDTMAAAGRAVAHVDPTLEGAAQSTLGRMQQDLRSLRNKVIQAAKRRDETLRRQFHHAQAQIFPGGEPQERAIAFVWLLDRYGPALVDRLLEDLPLDMGTHWVLAI